MNDVSGWLVDRLFCFLRGHDFGYPKCDPSAARIFLRCDICGYESPGWYLRKKLETEPEPLRTFFKKARIQFW